MAYIAPDLIPYPCTLSSELVCGFQCGTGLTSGTSTWFPGYIPLHIQGGHIGLWGGGRLRWVGQGWLSSCNFMSVICVDIGDGSREKRDGKSSQGSPGVICQSFPKQ